MKYLVVCITIFNIIFLINTIHFGFFAVFPFLKRKKINKIKFDIMHKFLIVIAARNEELVLGNLIDSINNQNYDKSLYRICVVPNNCKDKTKEIALKKKCLVIEPNIKIKSKGDVLNFVFDYFKKDNTFDSYVIFDADNILDKNFLLEINSKLNEGYKVVQGFRDTKNLYENFISGSYALFFYLQNLFLYTSRTKMGESSALNGTGYAILKDYIDRIKYRSKTVTEDIELTAVCAINNTKIGYSDKALFYDEQVSNFHTSIIQRKRWIQGSNQVLKTYYKKIFKALKNKRSFQIIDMIQILFLPINKVFAIVFLILTYIYIIPINYIIIGLILGYIGEVLTASFLVLFYKKNITKLIKAILFFPIFHISWIPIYFYAFFNTENHWEEIKHTKALKIEEMFEK